LKIIILVSEQNTSTVYASFNNKKESSENNQLFIGLIMKFKTLITCLYRKWVNYNLFLLTEDEHRDNNDDDNIQDPTIILKHQNIKHSYMLFF
jgi:hypothetical protein